MSLRYLQGSLDSLQGGLLFGKLTPTLQEEAEDQDQDAPDPPADDVPEEGRQHGFVHAGVGPPEEDWGGMLRAPPANRHIDDGNIDSGEDGEDSSESLGLAGGGEAPQHEVADVEEPE